MLSLWWLRDKPINIYGPPGTKKLTSNILEAYADDSDIRMQTTLSPVKIQEPDPVVSEYASGGVVYDDGEVKVEAFLVDHGAIEPAFGYKVTTPDKVTVISGDTTYDERIAVQAKGADYLIHEVYSNKGLIDSSDPNRPQRHAYHANQHTSIEQVAEIAKLAKPGLLVLTHILSWTDTVENMKETMAKAYDGKFVFAEDATMLE
ncbi:MBL fold metallo-hydrolase [Nitrincola sp.]|uniref:MBL fold metallo-hydrolase n=1 Tax=Nitrincola sp. TaxID=1926584 RepID=UPI003A914AEA